LDMEVESFTSSSFAEVFERNIIGRNHLLIVSSAEAQGNARSRVQHLDHVDFHIIRPVVEYLKAWKDLRIALVSNGAVDADTGKPLATKTPVVLYEPSADADASRRWSEGEARQGKAGSLTASNLFEFFRKG
jgi:2,3-bisphosphoglycerate-independent phosphoglycerate mutase